MISFLKTLYNPEIFQGNLRKPAYFEGWYFKHVSADLRSVYSFIPGISLAEEHFAFIQVLNGISGESEFIRYPIDAFDFRKDKFWVKVGESVFTRDFIDINIPGRFAGRLDYLNPTPYPTRLLSPGIMGWYSFIPTMECNHGLVSMTHGIKGQLDTPSGKIDFEGGKGYAEKDWGTSFPESYLWLQCNNFANPTTSLMVSVAKIPWKNHFFIGFLAFLHLDGRTHFFATYNNAKINDFARVSRENIHLFLTKGDYHLDIDISARTSGTLTAPSLGKMNKLIKESVDSEVLIHFSEKGKNTGLCGSWS